MKKKSRRMKLNAGMFRTIKGKIFLMGLFSIFVAVNIGVLGINSLNRSSSNSELETMANEIDVLQAKNLALEAQYQYYVEESYLRDILGNLSQMIKNAEMLQEQADQKYQKNIAGMLENLYKCRENYDELCENGSTRGFRREDGLYSQFLEADRGLAESFEALADRQDWLELKWAPASMWTSGDRVVVDGKEYVRLSYSGPVPEQVKRNSIAFRVGGTITYDRDCYITDVKLTGEAGELEIDLAAAGKEEGSGQAYVDSEIREFNTVPAIRVGCNFNAANECWEEFAVSISTKKYSPQEYENIEYTLYMEPTDMSYDFMYGGSYSGVYDFAGSLEKLDSAVDAYSKLVVEGKDTSDSYGQIETLILEMEENIPLYTAERGLSGDALERLKEKVTLLSQMKELDDKFLALKADNELKNSEITKLCGVVKDTAAKDIAGIKVTVVRVSIAAIVLAFVILVGMTVLMDRSIDKNVGLFAKTLDEVTQGRIGLRIRADGRDEFSQFGKSLNCFLDKLEESIRYLQGISTELAETGKQLEDKAVRTKGAAETVSSAFKEIAKGAGAQAEDISDSFLQVSNMQDNMLRITDSVNDLSCTSKGMGERGQEAAQIVQELSETSDRTTEAFLKISGQIHKTNESVVQIQEAVNLIAEIASQTNLLSLNASIEAARAGESGKGFAVVASEIQKLAEQTNSSAKVIDEIILSLSGESYQTVQSIQEVTEMIMSQKKKLDETKKKFSIVEDGITSTTGGMQTVLEQADVCGRAGKHVVGLMTSLSAIAEENAATTNQTNLSVGELNDATASFAKTAEELKKLSISITENLNYYKTENCDS